MKKFFVEIKNRIILLIFFTFFNFLFFYFNKEFLLFLLIKIMHINTVVNKLLVFDLQNYYLIFTDVTEIFYVYFNIVFFVNLNFLVYFAVLHVFLFFSPAFYRKERNKLFFLLKLSFSFFFLALVFSYFCIIPVTWNFFLKFQSYLMHVCLSNLYFEIKLFEYVDFCFNIYFYSFFYFQTLTLLYFFYQKLNSALLKKFRKIFYYFLLLSIIFISPFDFIINQILGFFFLVFLFETTFFLSTFRKFL